MTSQDIQNAIREKARQSQKVDNQGLPLAPPTAPQQQQPPTNLIDQLMDSQKFTEAAAKLDPGDTEAMKTLIQDHLGEAAPGMKPNPAQGRVGSTGIRAAAAPKKQMSLLESLMAQYGPAEKFDYSATKYVD